MYFGIIFLAFCFQNKKKERKEEDVYAILWDDISFPRVGVTSTILYWLVLAFKALPHQGVYGKVKTTLHQAEAWEHKSQAPMYEIVPQISLPLDNMWWPQDMGGLGV